MSWLGRTLIAIGMLVLAGALVTVSSYLWDDQSNPTTKAAVAATSPAITTNDVQIDGWIDDRAVTPGEPIKFWIVVQNPPLAREISNVEIVALRRPNFEIPAKQLPCWKTIPGAAEMPAETVPVCRNTSELSSLRLPEARVGPAGSVTIEGQLVAGQRRGKFGLTAVVGWVDSSGAHRRKPITVAPVVVESSLRNRLVYVTGILQSLLKDFALPVALLWLGFRIKAIETAREEARKQTDDRVARVQQTWTLMLPKVHENAEKYYIPLMSYAGSAGKYYESEPDYAFFFYASFLSQMKRMNDAIGGFYLKDEEGEEVVSLIWEALLDEADSPRWFGRIERERLQLAVDPSLTYTEFRNTLRNAAVAAARTRFVDKANHFERQLPLFRMFSHALWFETNVCYAFWYDDPPKFPTKDFKEALQQFKTACVSPDQHSTLIEVLERYTTSVQKRGKDPDAAGVKIDGRSRKA